MLHPPPTSTLLPIDSTNGIVEKHKDEELPVEELVDAAAPAQEQAREGTKPGVGYFVCVGDSHGVALGSSRWAWVLISRQRVTQRDRVGTHEELRQVFDLSCAHDKGGCKGSSDIHTELRVSEPGIRVLSPLPQLPRLHWSE